MRVSVVTMNVKQGKCEENFAYMKQQIEAAVKENCDLIVFPQNAISGYLLGDRWLEDAWCKYVDSYNDRLIELSDSIAIVWGNIRYRNQRRFNAAFFAYQGNTHMRVKPNENLEYFNDERYFEENTINSAIEFKEQVLALNFGEKLQLCDLNINIDAHPYDMEETTTPQGSILYVNACGVQNNQKSIMIMQGGSYAYVHQQLIYQAPYFDQSVQIIDFNTSNNAQPKKPELLDALLCGIKEFDAQVLGGKCPWIVGLSGGLDSSVACALLAMALGKKRIHGYNMATVHNRFKTIDNASKEAKALGINYKAGSIEAFVKASEETFVKEFGFDLKEDASLVLENIQARARGYLLSGFAGILGGVVVNNGNKVESLLGYCTLYGDSIGAISILGDLTKVQLFDLSHEINARMKQEIIPENLLPIVNDSKITWEMAPSAELKEDQYDPMKWFYHDYLTDHLGRDLDVITFMKGYLHHTLDEDLNAWIKYYHLDDPQAFLSDLDWFLNTIERNGFKRLQTPPTLCVHKKTLATQVDAQMRYDRKMYQEIRQQIETM